MIQTQQIPGPTPSALHIEDVMAQWYPIRKIIGRAYWPDLSELEDGDVSFFAYPFDFTLTAYQTLQQQLSVRGPFYLWGLTGNGAGAFSVQLRDGRTRQLFMEQAIDSSSVVGSGQHPYMLLQMHVIPGLRPVSVTVTDTSGNANNVEVCLLGGIRYGN
jgi:hypothetical protein